MAVCYGVCCNFGMVVTCKKGLQKPLECLVKMKSLLVLLIMLSTSSIAFMKNILYGVGSVLLFI